MDRPEKSSARADQTAIPPDAWFVGSVSARVYYPLGNPHWRAVPEHDRVWFTTDQEAEQAGYRQWASGLEDLEDFEIVRELGRGGTAIVYLARDRVLDRQVAIKLIKDSYEDDPETVERFAREIRLIAGLRHPNIVPAHAVKRLRGGGLALIMGYVAGPTLREVIRSEGALPPERIEQILRDLAGALGAAHQQRIVHRDVKPDNVFIEEGTGRALLADFGIAVHLDSPSRLTRDGFAVGTPTYMSPEQIDGRSVDGRSDLYSLALIGWEMAAGEKPWSDASVYSVIYKQKNESLPTLRKLRPDVPLRLSLAIEGALAKDPNARWSGADEFLAQLSGDPITSLWRHAPTALLWKRRATARVAAIANPLTSAAGEAMETVVYRRGDSPERDPRSHSAEAGSPEPRLKVRPSAAAAAVTVLGLVALALGLRQPIAATDARLPDASRGGDVPARVAGLSTVDPPVPASGPYAGALPPSAAEDALETDDPTSPPLAEATDSPAAPVPPDEGAGNAGAPSASAPADAEAPPAPEAIAVPVQRSRSRIAAGGMHTCEASGGELICWGGNDRGQLGSPDGGRTSVPVRVEGGRGFQAVIAGGFHSCALNAEGAALCWGDNAQGQLGAGHGLPTGPVRITAPRFHALALGVAHTCGLARDGALYCWGDNAHGQLGTGDHTPRYVPTRLTLNATVVAVAAGWSHSCALTREGQIVCWGQNDRGQLGDGTAASRAGPAAVRSSLPFGAVAAGSAHSCGLSLDGEVFCWGQNSDGRLGDGTTTDRSSPTRVQTSQRFVQISAGGRHTCALTRDGAAYCWGQNNYGQLGSGDLAPSASPVRVRTQVRFATIESSGAHTCGMTSAGASYCWGYNIEGQLGDGTQTHRSTPIRVQG